ncbi:MAG: hypothetical protein GVY21_01920 [Gammaproteobacteria bacterium]|jgi:hypothetical protein|nr:hypothetical protein [Gammaproteobacteria bacterium]
MKNYISLVLLAAALCLPQAALADDARSILQTMRDKQLERWEGVNLYVVEQTLMGHATQTYYQRTEVEADNGETQTMFLPVPPTELTAATCGNTRRMTPEELRTFAGATEMTGAALGSEMESGMADAGLPPGLLGASGSSPTATFDPRVMMGGNAEFLRAAASAEEANAAGPDGDQMADQMAQFMAKARLEGTEKVDGRRAYRLHASGLNSVQATDDGEFELQDVTLFIDTEHYVPVKTTMTGKLTSNGETRPVTIEKIDGDYRSVPGSSLYEPYRQVVKMEGMMDPAQQAEMREAQAQMAEMEQQLASMPESQRAMMERMMGPQLETIRNMAAGGGFQMEIAVDRIAVNPEGDGPNGQPCAPGPINVAAKSAPASARTVAASGGGASGGNLTTMVQRDLTALGYDTGGTSGEMTTATIVAISKFQAENGMEVTGEVTPQLAGILSARASGGAAAGASAAAAPARTQAELEQARQECLQEKIAAAQEAQKKKRGFGRLMSGIGRVANRFGGDFGREMAEVSRDIYDVNATAADLSQAAKDLGLTEDEIESCRNP